MRTQICRRTPITNQLCSPDGCHKLLNDSRPLETTGIEVYRAKQKSKTNIFDQLWCFFLEKLEMLLLLFFCAFYYE